MKVGGGLFSEKEIQKMASPERLDTMVAVTKQRGWYGLAAVCLLILQLLVWGIFGRVVITVKGQGIMLKSQIVSVEAGADGRIAALLPVGAKVFANDPVHGASIVAKVDLSGTRGELDVEKNRLVMLERDDEVASERDQRELTQKLAALNDERARLPDQIQSAQILLQAKEQAHSQAERNLASGIIVASAVTAALQDKTDARLDLEKKQNRLKSIQSEITTAQTEAESKRKTRELQIKEVRIKYNAIANSLNSGTDIRTTVDGTVLEHLVDKYEIVSANDVIMTIEPEKDPVTNLAIPMEAVIYVPAEEAKKIPVGPLGSTLRIIAARVNPSTAKAEEYGFMLGEVSSVSAYPVTPEGLKRVLRNDALVQKLMEKGPPIEVRAKLNLRDPAKPEAGYMWSSPGQDKPPIATGTMCTATFEIERKPPISYVIPMLKKATGL
jgi:HlyD family secretion protein